MVITKLFLDLKKQKRLRVFKRYQIMITKRRIENIIKNG